jgi:two-component system CheB/CheR fusion protein
MPVKKAPPREKPARVKVERAKVDPAKAPATRKKAAPSAKPSEPVKQQPLTVVGMVASAGGLSAFKEFFQAMPADSGMAFVLIPHLDPKHESLMAPLLSKQTRMPVMEAEEGQPLEANHVYVIPPNHCLTLHEGMIQLSAPPSRGAGETAIDPFLRSLAEDQQEQAVCIILSGTGTHGSLGLKAVKAAGGMTMVQEPASAEYDRMPQSAIDTGLADYVLSPGKMPEELIKFVQHFVAGIAKQPEPAAVQDDLAQVMALLRARTQFDFRSYRKRMLLRRVQRRMGLSHLDTLADYLALLREKPEELTQLTRDLLISVTAFFRDPEMFQVLETEVLPKLIDERDPDTPVRVWVPGCATGEEAYSIAMLLIERIAATGKACPIQIFATDVDEGALEVARRGIYAEALLSDLSRKRVERFFTRADPHHWQVSKQLRETVLFASQNILADAPFSKLDMVSCRNLLIYLEPDAQQKLLQLFHFALNEDGYLILGPSESIGRQVDLYQPVSKKWRIFHRTGTARPTRAGFPIQAGEPIHEPRLAPRSAVVLPNNLSELTRKILLEDYAPAAVVINRRYEVLHYSGPTQLYLQQPGGPPSHDLLTLSLPALRPRIRAAVIKAINADERTDIGGIRLKRGGKPVLVRLAVQPLPRNKPAEEGLFLVTFQDEPELPQAAGAGAEQTKSDEQLVRQLEYELKTSREELQSTIEELESSNEELKASNEEVMSMNEELQSTNEELETSKEELQSLNEELSTVNSQLRDKVDELEDSNNDMSNLLASVENATLFLGVDHTIQRFTPSATRLFNLIATDIGRPIDHITARVDDPNLLRDIDQVLQNLAPIEKEVSRDQEAWYLRRITPYRTSDNRISGVVLTLTDITAIKKAELGLRNLTEHLEQRVSERTAELEAEIAERRKAEQALSMSEQKFRALFQDAPIGIIQTDPNNGCFLTVNPRFCDITGYSEAELVGRPFTEITHPDDHTDNLEGLFRLGCGEIQSYQAEKRYIRKDGAPIWVDLKVILVCDAQGHPLHALGVVSDITERKQLQLQLTEHSAQLQHERNFIDAVLNTAAALIVVFDAKERLVRYNTACNTLTGYNFAEFKGTTRWLDLIPKDEMQGARQVIDALRSGKDAVQHENHWIGRDGTRRLLNWHNSALRDETGKIQFMIGTGIDITEQRKAEIRAREVLEDASRLQRLQTAHELATVLAHELNQPLAAIASYAEAGKLLLSHTPLEQDKLALNLEKISKQSLRAGEAIRHVRAFVGRGRIDPVPLDLNAVVRNTCSLMAPKSRSRNVNIVLDLDETLPPVLGVDVHIEQVLLNLMRNAVDAIRDAKMKEGSITVSTRRVDDMAQVSVCDTGPGIDGEMVDKVFEPLASNKDYGLGVGLRISRSLIDAHGGRLWVEPHAPGGIFHFVLPFAP